MHKLEPDQYYLAAPYLSEFSNHTVLKTIQSGITRGHLYVDSLHRPSVVFAQFRHRVFYINNNDAANPDDFNKFVMDVVFNYCRQSNVPLFRLTADSPASLTFLKQQLTDLEPIIGDYQIYQYEISSPIQASALPDGYELRRVNQTLVAEEFEGKQDLQEEMCSERESVQAFLDNSFGLVALKDNALAGWCLSEYNYQQRCEVGIATMPPHRKLGVAKAMTRSFLKLAAEEGIETILWHCSKSNIASSRTALSAGFTLAEDKPVLIVYLDRSINLAVHGNIYFEKGDFGEALDWYQKALAGKAPQAWMAWNAACAAAHLGHVDPAFKYLMQSVELGFTDMNRLTQSPHLNSLRGDPRWKEIIITLNQKLFAGS